MRITENVENLIVCQRLGNKNFKQNNYFSVLVFRGKYDADTALTGLLLLVSSVHILFN